MSIHPTGLRPDSIEIEEDAVAFNSDSDDEQNNRNINIYVDNEGQYEELEDKRKKPLEKSKDNRESDHNDRRTWEAGEDVFLPSLHKKKYSESDEENRNRPNEPTNASVNKFRQIWMNSTPKHDPSKRDSQSGKRKLEDPGECSSSGYSSKTYGNGACSSCTTIPDPPDYNEAESERIDDPDEETSSNNNNEPRKKIASSSTQLDRLEKFQLEIASRSAFPPPIKIYLPTKTKSKICGEKIGNQREEIRRGEEESEANKVDPNQGLVDEEEIIIEDETGPSPDPFMGFFEELGIKLPIPPIDLPDSDDEPEPELEDMIWHNPRALQKTDKTYQLEKFERKILFIFHYTWCYGYKKSRKGNQEDVDALKRTFSDCGFNIIDRHDKDKADIFGEISNFLKRDLSSYGCIAVAILTHGGDNGVLKAHDSQTYTDREILELFKIISKPELVTKPVVLIIQACRGTNKPKGIAAQLPDKIHEDSQEKKNEKVYHLPVECDTLVFHSSYNGKPAYRPENGTWFIQTLCEEINKLRETHDLRSIMFEVQTRVAIERSYKVYNKATNEVDINKQMPVITSTLIRKLYLLKYGETLKVPELQPIVRSSTYDEVDTGVRERPVPELQVKFEACLCFIRQFDYMKRCLRYYVSETKNINDYTQGLLDIAKHQNTKNLGSTKATLENISKYLEKNAKNFPGYKYIYFYGASEIAAPSSGQYGMTELNGYWTRLTETFRSLSQSTIMIFIIIVLYLATQLIYYLIKG